MKKLMEGHSIQSRMKNMLKYIFLILKKSLDTEVLKYIEILHNGLFPGN